MWTKPDKMIGCMLKTISNADRAMEKKHLWDAACTPRTWISNYRRFNPKLQESYNSNTFSHAWGVCILGVDSWGVKKSTSKFFFGGWQSMQSSVGTEVLLESDSLCSQA